MIRFSDNRQLFVLNPEYCNERQLAYIKKKYLEIDRSTIIDFLTKHKILTFGAHFFVETNLDKDYWAEYHTEFKIRNSLIIEQLDKLFNEANNKGISTMYLFENFGTLLLVDSCVSCFQSSDVDIYADISEYKAIHDVITDLGFDKGVGRKINEKIMTTFKVNLPSINSYFYINFEWKIIARTYLINESRLKARVTNEIFNGNKFIKGNIKIFEPNLLMYLNLLHVAIGHFYIEPPGIRLYVDIDKLARDERIDWSKIHCWAKEDGNSIRVAVVKELYMGMFDNQSLPVNDLNEKEKKYFYRLRNYLVDKNGVLRERYGIFNQVIVESASSGLSVLEYVYRRLTNQNE